jgi:hypothetical protein
MRRANRNAYMCVPINSHPSAALRANFKQKKSNENSFIRRMHVFQTSATIYTSKSKQQHAAFPRTLDRKGLLASQGHTRTPSLHWVFRTSYEQPLTRGHTLRHILRAASCHIRRPNNQTPTIAPGTKPKPVLIYPPFPRPDTFKRLSIDTPCPGQRHLQSTRRPRD